MALSRLNRTVSILNILSVVALLVAMGMVFFYAPVERTMGNVQRLFYFHVASLWVGAVAFFVALYAGVAYLRKPQKKWDTIAVATIEIGLVFLTMGTVAGSIWGKPAWNTYWIWSPRLTTVTVAWLTYMAYFMLRGAIEEFDRRARFSAIYAIISFATIIMAYISIRILRDIHPVVFGGTLESAQGASQGLQEFSGVDSLKMVVTLNVCILAFTFIYAAWMANRYRLQLLIDEADQLKMRVATRMRARRG